MSVPASIKQLTDRLNNEAEKLGNEIYVLNGVVRCLLRRLDADHVIIDEDEWRDMLYSPDLVKQVKSGQVELWLSREKNAAT